MPQFSNRANISQQQKRALAKEKFNSNIENANEKSLQACDQAMEEIFGEYFEEEDVIIERYCAEKKRLKS